MKSALPGTKFKLHAHEHPGQKRLEVRLNKYSPSPSGPTTDKELKSDSEAAKLLCHLDQLSQPKARLHSSPVSIPPHYELPEIPRYIFAGDQPGESEIRLGIFGLRAEDNVGAKAIVEFLDDLVAIPSLGSAFRIYAYPIAHPRSYTTGIPCKRTDRKGAHENGRKVKSPEAYLIERETFVVQFHGLVVIHTTDQPEGFQAAVYGANLHKALVTPILSSLRPLFPTSELPALDTSFSFSADAVLKQRPFELVLRIPRSGWHGLHSLGLRIALHTAVEQYRWYLAQANNI
jgi:hypothetical protein